MLASEFSLGKPIDQLSSFIPKLVMYQYDEFTQADIVALLRTYHIMGLLF